MNIFKSSIAVIFTIVSTCSFAQTGNVPAPSKLYRNIHADNWMATDALGNKLPGYDECGPLKQDRYVGMFYFINHNNPNAKGPFDVTKIVADNPDNPNWGEGTHYWGQPEYGYYLSYDEWVIRKHAELLSDAGVDVIIFDVTNDRTYPDVYLPVCKVFAGMRAKGEKTPSVAFLGSEVSVNRLWKEFYEKGLYSDLWFQWKDKPLLLYGQHEIPSRKKNNDIVFSNSIRNFFSMRQSWAWTTLPWYQTSPYGKDKWPWIDHFPQAIGWHERPEKAEMVPVAVAQHPLSNIGRSFHNFCQPAGDKYDLTPYTNEGLCFEEQWTRALEVGPEFIFVTGWNEWSAGAQVMGNNISKSLQKWAFYPGAHLGKAGKPLKVGDYYFIDQYNQEFSRDIEPMAGGHTDNYYYKLVANIRKYKGMEKPMAPATPVEVNIAGSFLQWDKVSSAYYDHLGDVVHRNIAGAGQQAGIYLNKTGRNDLVTMKVAADDTNIYFYAETDSSLSPYQNNNWMLLFIDADEDNNTGWEGYDFVVNAKVIDDKTTTIALLNKDGSLGTFTAIPYAVKENKLMLSINRSIVNQNKKVNFQFHWADNINKIGDITEFFLNGDNAPERRANYLFQLK